MADSDGDSFRSCPEHEDRSSSERATTNTGSQKAEQDPRAIPDANNSQLAPRSSHNSTPHVSSPATPNLMQHAGVVASEGSSGPFPVSNEPSTEPSTAEATEVPGTSPVSLCDEATTLIHDASTGSLFRMPQDVSSEHIPPEPTVAHMPVAIERTEERIAGNPEHNPLSTRPAEPSGAPQRPEDRSSDQQGTSTTDAHSPPPSPSTAPPQSAPESPTQQLSTHKSHLACAIVPAAGDVNTASNLSHVHTNNNTINSKAPVSTSSTTGCHKRPRAAAKGLPELKIAKNSSSREEVPVEPGVIVVDKSSWKSSNIATTANLNSARMQLCNTLLKVIQKCATIPSVQFPPQGPIITPPQNPTHDLAIADTLYQASLAFLALAACSSEAVSISLAFYGGANTLARALRAPRTLRDWGARVIVLGVVVQVACTDTDAAQQLIQEGMLATVELSLHVAVQDQDWLSAHLCMDALLTFAAASADTAVQALACPLIETLCRLLRRILRALRASGTAAAAAAAAAAASAAAAAAAAADAAASQQASALGAAIDADLVTRALPTLRTPLRISPATVPEAPDGTRVSDDCTAENFPSATEAVLAECANANPEDPTTTANVSLAGTSHKTLREVPGSNAITPKLSHPTSPDKHNGNNGNNNMDSNTVGDNVDSPVKSYAATVPLPAQEPSLDSMLSPMAEDSSPKKGPEGSHFSLQLDVGEEADLHLLQKALRLLCALAAGSPAHRTAFQELRAVKILVSLLRACELHLQPLCRNTPNATPNATPKTPHTDSAKGAGVVFCWESPTGKCGQFLDERKVGQVAQAMQHTLWALSTVVDGCAAAERDFLDCGGIADVSKLLHRTLTSPAMEAMHERHAHLQSPPPKPSFSRRCAELQQAHATHSCIEKAAALAVPTPMVKNVLISDFLGTPRKGPEASPCWTNSSELMTPYSNATPKYLKSPSAHAEQTLQVLGCPVHPESPKKSPFEDVLEGSENVLVHSMNASSSCAIVALIARLMRTLAVSGHRCKDSLNESSASLLLMHALRQLRMHENDSPTPDTPGFKSQTPTFAPPSEFSHALSETSDKEDSQSKGLKLKEQGQMHEHVNLSTAAIVGATLVAGGVIVKGRTATETYDNYRNLSHAIRFVTEQNEKACADAQWLSLRHWIVEHVVHGPLRHNVTTRSHHLLLSDGTICSAETAQNAVAAVCTHAVGGAGNVPELAVRQELMHALAEVGFSHSVQSTAIMDSTLCGVIQMLGKDVATTECLQACEVLQQMCQLSDSMAMSVLHEGALWRLSCLLMSFRDLLPTRDVPMLTTSPSGGTVAAAAAAAAAVAAASPRAAAAAAAASAAFPQAAGTAAAAARRRAPPTTALAAARAAARACTSLLQRCPQARAPFVAMGGLHATLHLIRDLQSSRSTLVPELMWLLAAAVRDTPPAQLASLSDGLPLLLGRILNASVAPSSPPSAGSATGKPGASLGDECEVPSDHVELQIACCGALEALLDGCTAVQESLASTVTIQALEALLPRMDPMHPKPVSPTRIKLASAAADALCQALHCPKICDEFSQVNGATPLITSLMLPSTESVTLKLMYCTRMMCMHCSDKRRADACNAVRMHGGLLTVCMLLNEMASTAKGESERVVVAASRMLAAVAEGCSQNCEFATSGTQNVLPVLMRMLGAGHHSMIATAACRVLRALTTGQPAVQRRAITAGAPEALLFLCTAGAAAPAAAPAAAALAAVCDGRRGAAAAAAAGGAASVLAALLPARGASAAAAAAALAALASTTNPTTASSNTAAAVAALGQCLLAAAGDAATPAAAAHDTAVLRAAVRLVRANSDYADTLISAGAATALARMLSQFLHSPQPDNSTSLHILPMHTASDCPPTRWCIAPPSNPPQPPSPSPPKPAAQISEEGSTHHALAPSEVAPGEGGVEGSGTFQNPELTREGSHDKALCIALKLIPERVEGELRRPQITQNSTKSTPTSPGASKSIAPQVHAPHALAQDMVQRMSAPGGAPDSSGKKRETEKLQWTQMHVWDASYALERGLEAALELVEVLSQASPGAQSVMQQIGLVDTVASMLRAAQPEAACSACRALGALAFGNTHTKRHLLASGAAATLVSLLLNTPVATSSTHSLMHTHLANTTTTEGPNTKGTAEMNSTSANSAKMNTLSSHAADAMRAARALQDLALRSFSGEHSSASEPSIEGSAPADNQNPTNSDMNTNTFTPPIPATVFAQAASMLEVVLDSTSATAMQQLSLSVGETPLLGVATGVLGAVLGATARVVAPINCGRVSWTPATAPTSPSSPTGSVSPTHNGAATHGVSSMHDASRTMRAHMAATDTKATEQVWVALESLPGSKDTLPLRRAVCCAVQRLCSGSLEARKAIGVLQRELRTLAAHA